MIRIDHELLLGLLATQHGLVDEDRLVDAVRDWTCDESRGLADHLEGRGDLDPARRAELDRLVDRHLGTCGRSPGAALAAVTVDRRILERLASLGHHRVATTLAHLGVGSTDPEPNLVGVRAGAAYPSQGARYRVVREHARGGLGVIYVAEDAELHREVALKRIQDRYADDPACRQRFLREAEITGGLEHPGIVPVHSLGTGDDGRPFYAMRFLRGQTLRAAIEHFHGDGASRGDPGRRSLALRQLLRRFTDVCNAVEFAHARG